MCTLKPRLPAKRRPSSTPPPTTPQGHYTELSNILDLIPKPAKAGADADDVDGWADAPLIDGDAGEGVAEGLADDPSAAAAQAGKGHRRRRQLLQTLVFSATLTLPDALRKRLRRGGGGSSGAATLEGLMGRVAFRGEPAVVDLTTEKKLADRVTEAVIECLGG